MNTILMLAACGVLGLERCEAEEISTEALLGSVQQELKKRVDASGQGGQSERMHGYWSKRIAECQAWLAEYAREQERERMRESLKKRLDALLVAVLTDEERAEIVRAEEVAKAGGYVSNGEVLAGLLERACAEHDRVNDLVREFNDSADADHSANFDYAHGLKVAYRTCAKLLAAALEEPKDEPIADPAERAKAVAKELRRRGFWAEAVGLCVFVPQDKCDGSDQAIREDVYEREDFSAGRGPRSIADEIQREETRRARKWAGDE